MPFAVAGGFAADLYHRDSRLTVDVDFGLGNVLVQNRTVRVAADPPG